jgi:rSAM/selenodomain-associated transferase 1
MAKAPLAGLVKTRMSPQLSPEEAADLSRALLLDLLDDLKSFDEADLFLAFTPAEAASLFAAIVPRNFICFHQDGADLGERMGQAFATLFRRGYGSVVLLGSDLPVFPSRWLAKAFSWLNQSENHVALGPSRDGGYYLIGMRQLIAEIFHGIAWSSDKVLAMTLERLNETGVKPRLLPRWFDIDTLEDLRDLADHVRHSQGRFQAHTVGFLEALQASGKSVAGLDRPRGRNLRR